MEPKKFLLRIPPDLYAAVQRWAAEDLRSVNGQIEYLLRQAVLKRGVKLPEKGPPAATGGAEEPA